MTGYLQNDEVHSRTSNVCLRTAQTPTVLLSQILCSAKATMLFTIFFLSVSLADANTIKVPQDYPTIQQAIDAAADGDVVFISAGAYTEQLFITNKGITLMGESYLNTRIQYAEDQSDGNNEATITIKGTGIEKVNITGLELRAGTRDDKYYQTSQTGNFRVIYAQKVKLSLAGVRVEGKTNFAVDVTDTFVDIKNLHLELAQFSDNGLSLHNSSATIEKFYARMGYIDHVIDNYPDNEGSGTITLKSGEIKISGLYWGHGIRATGETINLKVENVDFFRLPGGEDEDPQGMGVAGLEIWGGIDEITNNRFLGIPNGIRFNGQNSSIIVNDNYFYKSDVAGVSIQNGLSQSAILGLSGWSPGRNCFVDNKYHVLIKDFHQSNQSCFAYGNYWSFANSLSDKIYDKMDDADLDRVLVESNPQNVTESSMPDIPPFFVINKSIFVAEEDADLTEIPMAARFIDDGNPNLNQTLKFHTVSAAPVKFDVFPEIDPDGTLRFKPSKDEYGLCEVLVYLEDDGGNKTELKPFFIFIRPHDDYPKFVNSVVDSDEDKLYTFKLSDFAYTDVDGGTILSEFEFLGFPPPQSGNFYFKGILVDPVNFQTPITVADIENGDLTFEPFPQQSGQNYRKVNYMALFTTPDYPNDPSAGFASIIININPVDDPPLLTDPDPHPIDYFQSPGLVSIYPDISISDIDSDILTQAIVESDNGWYPGEQMYATPSGGIQVTDMGYKLLLTGKAPLSEYEKTLQTVVYSYSGKLSFTRQMKVTVYSGFTKSNTVYKQIDVQSGSSARQASGQVITALESTESFEGNSIYPNPAGNTLNLDRLGDIKESRVRIISSEGKQLHDGPGKTSIDVSGLPNGVYTLILEKGGKASQFKFVKK